jgi:hypothetical protein
MPEGVHLRVARPTGDIDVVEDLDGYRVVLERADWP